MADSSGTDDSITTSGGVGNENDSDTSTTSSCRRANKLSKQLKHSELRRYFLYSFLMDF